MPSAAPKPCRHVGCSQLVRDGSGYCAAHQKARPGTFADRSRGTRHQRGYGSAWDALRKVVLQRDGGLCQYCRDEGRVTVATMVDHTIPKAEGGTDDPSNLRSICAPCHTRKTDREKNHRRRGGLNLWPPSARDRPLR